MSKSCICEWPDVDFFLKNLVNDPIKCCFKKMQFFESSHRELPANIYFHVEH